MRGLRLGNVLTMCIRGCCTNEPRPSHLLDHWSRLLKSVGETNTTSFLPQQQEQCLQLAYLATQCMQWAGWMEEGGDNKSFSGDGVIRLHPCEHVWALTTETSKTDLEIGHFWGCLLQKGRQGRDKLDQTFVEQHT